MYRMFILIFGLAVIFFPACGKKETPVAPTVAADKPDCVFGLVFLSPDADQNAAAREHLAAAKAGLAGRLCTVIVKGDAPDLAAAFGVVQRPAAVINGRPAVIDSTLTETCRQAQGRMPAGIHLTLAIAPADTGRLDVTYSVCSDEGTSLKDGSVVIMAAVRSPGQGAAYAGSMHRETGYTVEGGSCHRPGNAAMAVPEGTAPEALKIFGLVLDATGNLVATACAGGGCGGGGDCGGDRKARAGGCGKGEGGKGGCGGGGCGDSGQARARAGGCGDKPCSGPCKE